MKTIDKFIEDQIARRGCARVIVSDGRELAIFQGIGFRTFTFDGQRCNEQHAKHVIANRFHPQNIVSVEK